jgi:hypothetical protein
MAAGGNHVVLAYDNRIEVVDVADPMQPHLVAAVPREDDADTTALAVKGGLVAAVTCAPCEYDADPATVTLRLLDLRSGASARWSGMLVVGERVRSLALGDGFAYLAAGDGIRIADVRDPAEPLWLPSVPGIAGRLIIAGGALFDMGTLDTWQVFDLAEPGSPKLLATRTSETPTYTVAALAVEGNLLAVSYFIGHDSAVAIWDISNPAEPKGVSGVAGRVAGGYLGRDDVAWVGKQLHVAYAPGVNVFDMVDPAHPKHLGGVRVSEGVGAVVSGGGHGIAMTTRGLVTLVDAQADGTKVRGATHGMPLGDEVTGAAGAGSTVFVRSDVVDSDDPDVHGQIAIVDLADVTRPRWLASVPLQTEEGTAPVVVDDRVIVGLEQELAVVDVADPVHPTEMGHIPLDWQPRHIVVGGGRVIAISNGRFAMFAIGGGRADTWTKLATWTERFVVRDAVLAADGRTLYAQVDDAPGAINSRIVAFDLRNPTLPTLVAGVPSSASQLALVGNTLCAAEGALGVALYDVREPTSPRANGRLRLDAASLANAGPDRLAVASDGWLHLVDLREPGEPVILHSARVPLARNGKAPQVVVAADRLWQWSVGGRGWFGFPLE